jgi:hypothetical protein
MGSFWALIVCSWSFWFIFKQLLFYSFLNRLADRERKLKGLKDRTPKSWFVRGGRRMSAQREIMEVKIDSRPK